ncbi:MAG TPA: hypothetical protein VGO62_22075 [Myxococcota bacterium]|jgi:hypothetical protein
MSTINPRKLIAVAILSLGVVAGYGSGIYRMTHGGCSHEGAACAHSHWRSDR